MRASYQDQKTASTSWPYGVRPSSAQSFGDQLGRVRGTKSKIEDRYATWTPVTLGTTVGDLAGAQRLRLQLVVPELSHFFCSAQR